MAGETERREKNQRMEEEIQSIISQSKTKADWKQTYDFDGEGFEGKRHAGQAPVKRRRGICSLRVTFIFFCDGGTFANTTVLPMPFRRTTESQSQT